MRKIYLPLIENKIYPWIHFFWDTWPVMNHCLPCNVKCVRRRYLNFYFSLHYMTTPVRNMPSTFINLMEATIFSYIIRWPLSPWLRHIRFDWYAFIQTGRKRKHTRRGKFMYVMDHLFLCTKFILLYIFIYSL